MINQSAYRLKIFFNLFYDFYIHLLARLSNLFFYFLRVRWACPVPGLVARDSLRSRGLRDFAKAEDTLRYLGAGPEELHSSRFCREEWIKLIFVNILVGLYLFFCCSHAKSQANSRVNLSSVKKKYALYYLPRDEKPHYVISQGKKNVKAVKLYVPGWYFRDYPNDRNIEVKMFLIGVSEEWKKNLLKSDNKFLRNKKYFWIIAEKSVNKKRSINMFGFRREDINKLINCLDKCMNILNRKIKDNRLDAMISKKINICKIDDFRGYSDNCKLWITSTNTSTDVNLRSNNEDIEIFTNRMEAIKNIKKQLLKLNYLFSKVI